MLMEHWRRWVRTTLPFRRRARRPSEGLGRSIRLELQTLENRCLLSTVVLGKNFTGMDFNASAALTGTGVEPPDTDVATGPSRIVETANTVMSIYDRSSGALVSQTDLHTFFGLASQVDLTDPVVAYDEVRQRFIVAVIEQTNIPQQTSHLDFAVSNGSDPTLGFSEIHRFNVLETNSSAQLLHADYPTIGWNADAYVFSVNMYTFGTPPKFSDSTFDHTQVIALDKTSVLDGNPATLTAVQADLAAGANPDFTVAAARIHDAKPGAPMWFVEENPAGGNASIEVVRMTNVLSTPSFTGFQVPLPASAVYTNVVSPAQPGTNVIPADALGTPILNAAVRGNTLVAAQTVGAGSDDHARWYVFNISSGTPTLQDWGDIAPAVGVDTYVPAIDIAPDGSLGMSYLESSKSEPLSMYVTGRTPADIPGTMDAPVLAKAGQTSYNGARLGDFSGLSIDPTTGAFWAANEFANDPTKESVNWGTQITNFALSAPGSPPTPKFANVNLSATVTPPGQGPVVFIVTPDHALYQHDDVNGLIQIGGSGSILSISAVTEASGNVVVFAMGTDHALDRYSTATGWDNGPIGTPGTVLAISAGTDSNGLADVFVIGGDTALLEWTGTSGWLPALLSGPGSVVSISATTQNRVFVVATDGSVLGHDDQGWFRESGSGFAGSVSAVADAAGNVTIFAVTQDNGLFRHVDPGGWGMIGGPGSIQSISAGTDANGQANVFAMTAANDFAEFSIDSGWQLLGESGSILAMSAADADRVFVITADHSVFEHDDLAGWQRDAPAGFALA